MIFWIHKNEIHIYVLFRAVYMIISERILKVLEEREMTQVEFARQAGLSASTISEW